MIKEMKPLYDRCPVFLQNLTTSSFGYFLQRRRYSRDTFRIQREIEESQWFSRDELLDLQMSRLRAILLHARKHVPYYRRRFADAGFDPDKLRFPEQMLDLPVLRREDIVAHERDLIADNAATFALNHFYTSGTTGTPLSLWANREVLSANYAHWLRLKSWMGLPKRCRRATMSGRIICPPSQVRPPYWRQNLFENQLLFSSFHLSPRTAGDYLARLAAFRPHWLEGYVTTWYTLAHMTEQLNLTPGFIPLAVTTSSETLLERQREVIQRVFKCRVFNQYGHGEHAVFVGECAAGGLHISTEFCLLELVVDGRRHARPGEVGEVVVTSLYNRAMPLIRYRTGDLATATDSVCPCGRGLPLLESIEGRVIDVIVTPEGRRIPPTALTLLFDKADKMKIDKVQVLQKEDGNIVIRLVERAPLSPADFETIEQDLRSMAGQTVRISFAVEDDIPVEKNGKFRFVVSRYRNRRV